MMSIATRTMTQVAVAGGAALRSRRRGVALLQTAARRPFLCIPELGTGRRGRVARITAVATPVRMPGLGAQESAVPAAPLVLPAPAPARQLGGGLGGLWHAYLHSLERRPLLTKAATSFVCVVLGDTIAQLIGGAPYSVARVLRLASYSAGVGASVGHHWHRWLEANVHPDAPGSTKAVATKTFLDQFAMSPVMLLAFFAAIKLLEGQPEQILPHMQAKFASTLVAGYALWIPYNVAAFKWIPQDLRILAGNMLGIGWGTYLSLSCVNTAPAVACQATVVAAAAVAAAQSAQQ